MRDGLEKYAVGVGLADRHGAVEGRPGGFDLLDVRWDLLPGVFSPLHTASTELFTSWVPYPVGGHFADRLADIGERRGQGQALLLVQDFEHVGLEAAA